MSVTPKRELSLFDSTSIIVGIIIGAGIYQMAPDIAKGAGSALGRHRHLGRRRAAIAVRRDELRGAGDRLPAWPAATTST